LNWITFENFFKYSTIIAMKLFLTHLILDNPEQQALFFASISDPRDIAFRIFLGTGGLRSYLAVSFIDGMRPGLPPISLTYHDGNIGHTIAIQGYDNRDSRFIYSDPWPDGAGVSLLSKDYNAAGI
jgi:hypothetical protein